MNIAKRSIKLKNESAFEVLSKVNELKNKGIDVINLGIGQPDFIPPVNVIKAGIKALNDENHGYRNAMGILELREAIVKEIYRDYNQTVNKSNILITPGAKAAIYITIQMIVEKNSEVIIPDPGFPIYRSAILSSGAKPVYYKLREEKFFSLDPFEILKKVNKNTKLIIINSPSNPTGSIIPFNDLKILFDGLKEYPNIFILSDEIYSKLIFNKNKFTSLLEFPELNDRLILVNGLSKSFAMTGWRIGWGIFPNKLKKYAEKFSTNIFSCVNFSSQMAAIEALNGPQEIVKKMNSIYKKRSKIMTDGINKINGFSCIMPQGAFYCFANIKNTGFSSLKLQEKILEEAGVAIIAGSSFGQYSKNFIRLSCAAKENDIKKALVRIKNWGAINID